MDKVKMGFFLTTLRNEKNLTQQDEADIFSITPQAISKWESGQSVPDVETLEKISSFYGVSINEILNGERGTKAKTEERQHSETSQFGKMLINRLTPFILSCSLFVATLITYAFPYLSDGGFTVNMYSIIGGGASHPINILSYLAFFTMISIFGLGFGVFFSKNLVLRFHKAQEILIWVLLGLNVLILILLIAWPMSPNIGYFLTLIVVIAYIVLFMVLPKCKRNYLKTTIVL
ncbi:MAG: helix-turn-helix domain-containing protein [Bacilli bacterium]|nr:helix-turn-helix domain-containing protein [Bacilli bacterium]